MSETEKIQEIKDEEINVNGTTEDKLQKDNIDDKDQELKSKEKKTEEDKKKEKDSIFSAFNLQKFLMEFIGSFAIIYFGNWSQIFSDLGMSNQIAVSIVIGFFMTIFTWIGVDVSGAHYNPITTVKFSFEK